MKLFIDCSAGQDPANGYASDVIADGLEGLANEIVSLKEHNPDIEAVILHGFAGRTSGAGNYGFFDNGNATPLPLEFSRASRSEPFRFDGFSDFIEAIKAAGVSVVFMIGAPHSDQQLKRAEMTARAKRNWTEFEGVLMESLEFIFASESGVLIDDCTGHPIVSPTSGIYRWVKDRVSEYGGLVGVGGTPALSPTKVLAAVPEWETEEKIIPVEDWIERHSADQTEEMAGLFPQLEKRGPNEPFEPYPVAPHVVISATGKGADEIASLVARVNSSGSVACLTRPALDLINPRPELVEESPDAPSDNEGDPEAPSDNEAEETAENDEDENS